MNYLKIQVLIERHIARFSGVRYTVDAVKLPAHLINLSALPHSACAANRAHWYATAANSVSISATDVWLICGRRKEEKKSLLSTVLKKFQVLSSALLLLIYTFAGVILLKALWSKLSVSVMCMSQWKWAAGERRLAAHGRQIDWQQDAFRPHLTAEVSTRPNCLSCMSWQQHLSPRQHAAVLLPLLALELFSSGCFQSYLTCPCEQVEQCFSGQVSAWSRCGRGGIVFMRFRHPAARVWDALLCLQAQERLIQRNKCMRATNAAVYSVSFFIWAVRKVKTPNLNPIKLKVSKAN